MKKLLLILCLLFLYTGKSQDFFGSYVYNGGEGYGALYNWYAATDARGFVAGWHVSTEDDWWTLTDYLGAMSLVGKKLKESGSVHWEVIGNPANTGTNEYGFNSRGTGYRDNTGAFGNLKTTSNHGAITTSWGDSWESYVMFCIDDQVSFWGASDMAERKNGYALRLVKNDSTNPGSVTIDGVIYPTVKIGDQVWLAANLIAKHYANGDLIPIVSDNSTWAALDTGAMCYYNNNPKYR